MTAPVPYGKALRRFTSHITPGGRAVHLLPNHPATRLGGATLFPNRRTWPGDAKNILKSGGHNRKIGARVVKGKWKGMPIFTLTLEERATCPLDCQHWLDCYGNKMQWSERLVHGAALERLLGRALGDLNAAYPGGFVVRLHILGDFYSVSYVRRWLSWLRRFPALHVYGYSQWPVTSPIGSLVRQASDRLWERFAVRTSNGEAVSERGARTIHRWDYDVPIWTGNAILCPVQTDRTDCCGTCGLCWGTRRNIAFLAH